jgi:hypothetical protein
MVMVSNLPDSSLPLNTLENKILIAQNNRFTKSSILDFASQVALSLDPSSIDHDQLFNYNPLDHIDWTNTTYSLQTTGTIQGSNFSGTSSGSNTGDQNLFQSFKVLGELPATDIVAGNPTDAFTFVPGPNVTITPNPTTKELTISFDTSPNFGIVPIDVTLDTFIPDGLTNGFPLTATPANVAQTLCFFDGLYESSSNYIVLPVPEVDFTTPPPNYISKIDFYTYHDDDLLLTQQELFEGVDYNAGDTVVTISNSPADLNHILIFFDGVFVGVPSYGVAGTTVTFVDPIPSGVKRISCIVFEDTGINPTDIDVGRQVYLDGVNFTAGLTDILVMPSAIDEEQDALVFIDGVFLGRNNYVISNALITFNSPIPTFTQKVEIISLTGQAAAASADPAFGVIAVSGELDVIATTPLDTLNLVAGTDINISTNGVDTVTFDYTGAAEANTASNIGGFTEIFKQKTGLDFEFRTLQSTSSEIVVTENVNDVALSFDGSAIDHDALLNFVANEHIDWTNATQNLLTTGTLASSNLSGTNTGDQNLWHTIVADSGSTIAGDPLDTLAIAGGTNVTTTIVGDTLTIDAADAGEVNTASNIGPGLDVFIQKTINDLEFRGFDAGSGLQAIQSADTITYSAVPGQIDHDQLLNFIANEHIDWTNATQNLVTTGTIDSSNYDVTGSVAAGSANSGTNTGDQSIWSTITASTGPNFSPTVLSDTLNFIGGTNITVTSNGTDTLTIDAASIGENNTASNVGGFNEVFKQKTGVDLEFRTLQSTNGTVSFTQAADYLDLFITPGTGFTESYVSPPQIITPGGGLTLAHGLSGKPALTFIVLENIVPEYGYLVGDDVPANTAVSSASNNQGSSVIADNINLNILFGAGSGGGTPVFSVIDRLPASQLTRGITNSSWLAHFIAVR